MPATVEDVAARLKSAKRVMVTCHRGPDGDSVGSMVALASVLRRQEKEVAFYSPDLVPRNLKWMAVTKTVVHRLKEDAKFDCTVVVDCGDPKLLGDEFPKKEVTGDLIVLDHHSSHREFGDLFICDPSAAAVGVIIARVMKAAGWRLTREAAVGIFVSLVADTGSFRYANTDGEALQLAADLVQEYGVDPWEVSEHMTERGSLARYRLMSAALATLETAQRGRVAFMFVTDEMVQKAGASWEDSEGLVNYARAIRGVECGVLLTPAKHGGIRVSLRSKGHVIDAGAVCLEFGGGGHRGAAGCTLAGDDISQARTQVEAALARAIESAEAPKQA